MKILHVYKDFEPPVHGGIERHMALMCRYQQEHAEVSALTCSRSLRTRHVTRNGIPVLEVGEWGRLQNSPLAPLYPYHLMKEKADITVIHSPMPTAEVSWLFPFAKGKMIVRYHSDVVRQAAAMKVYKPLLIRFLKKADLIIPTSKPYLETSPYLGLFKEKCRVVPLGIVAEEFQNADAAKVQSIKDSTNRPIVLFTGRHRYYKGLEFLVKASNDINGTVIITGEGPQTSELKAMATSMNSDIRFTGRLDQSDLIAHLHACDVFAFPSVERSEAFGISILEAHASGKPVVATTLGSGVEFANLHDKTGLNVPPKDSEALAKSINYLLDNSDVRKRMGDFAQHRVEHDFHAKSIAEQELALYEELLANG